MNATSTSHQEHIKSHVCTAGCISWTAIVLGALTAVSLSFILNLLALAIGLTAFPTGENGVAAFAVTGFVGLAVISIVVMFTAGWVAGVLGRGNCLRRKMGELYGIGTWCLALILYILLASSVGQFFSQTNYLINRNVVAVKLTEDVSKGTIEPTKKAVAAVQTLKVHPETAAISLGIGTFVTFFLFFIGFLSCCFGGRVGMTYRRKSVLNSNYCPHCK